MNKINELKSFLRLVLPEHIRSGAEYLSDRSSELSTAELTTYNFNSPIRLQEFSTGRSIAKKLLEEAGAPPVDLISDSRGLVTWPSSFVGSISHKKNICAVIVSERPLAKSLGLDIEICSQIDGSILDSILTSSEITDSRKLNLPIEKVTNLYLSAKESFYKYQYPLTGLRLDFHDLELDFDLDKGIFKVTSSTVEELMRDEAICGLSSKIGIFGDLICTVCY